MARTSGKLSCCLEGSNPAAVGLGPRGFGASCPVSIRSEMNKEIYFGNGVLGVLAHLAEFKLIFAEEYQLLHESFTAKDAVSGPVGEVLETLASKTTETYRAEDLFNLVGLLAKLKAEKGIQVQEVKVSGLLDKLPFGNPNRNRSWWKPRFFRLQGNGVAYFARQSDSKPKGQIILTANSFIRDAEAPGRKHCFDIITQNGTLCVATNSEAEKERWVCAISRKVHSISSVLQSKDFDNAHVFKGRLRVLSTGRKWKLLHFVLYRNLLSCFESEGDKKSKGDFILDPETEVCHGLPDDLDDPEDFASDCLFYVRSKEFNFTLPLAALSTTGRKTWLDALENALVQGELPAAPEPQKIAQEFLELVPLEIIYTHGLRQATPAASIGRIEMKRDQTLLELRERIYIELNESDVPLDFCFLLRMNKAVRSARSLPKDLRDSPLLRFLEFDYTKISDAQEKVTTLEKFLADGARIYLFGERQQNSTISEAEHKEEEAKSFPEDEKKALEKMIRDLRSRLTEAQRMLNDAMNARAEIGEKRLSPLMQALVTLQRDGYLEEEVSLKELKSEYKKLFNAEDLHFVTASLSFEKLFRQFAADPKRIRAFIEAMEEILSTYKVSRNRLSEPWWKKMLSKPEFLTMSRSKLMEWALGEPWTEDTPERYAYLMAKMKPDTLRPEEFQLLHSIPPTPITQISDDEDEKGTVPSCPAAARKQTKNSKSAPPPPPFLDSIRNLQSHH